MDDEEEEDYPEHLGPKKCGMELSIGILVIWKSTVQHCKNTFKCQKHLED